MTSKIVTTALHWVGQEEKKNNAGFLNPTFEKLMLSYGWQKGWAWCSVFGELCWRESYKDECQEEYRILGKLFSPSAVQTWRNFENNPYAITFDMGKEAKPGAIAVWQSARGGKLTWTGHVGIVVKVEPDGSFWAVEGNGSVGGSREGTHVVQKKRTLNFAEDNGLRLLGFIYPSL